MGRSSAEGLIPWKTPGGRLGRAAASAVGDVLVNALHEGTDYSAEQALLDFAVGFIGDLAGGGIGELVNKYGLPAIAKGLKNIGLNAESIIKNIGLDFTQGLLKNTSIGLRGDASSYYTYKELKGLINDLGLSGRNQGFEAHHLLEKQFADAFGISQDDIIVVALTPGWHRGSGSVKIIGEGFNINDAIEKELKSITGAKSIRGALSNATTEQIWLAHRNVYNQIGQSNWANAIYGAYVKDLGIGY